MTSLNIVAVNFPSPLITILERAKLLIYIPSTVFPKAFKTSSGSGNA